MQFVTTIPGLYYSSSVVYRTTTAFAGWRELMDSVVYVNVRQAGYPFVIAHYHFGLQGKESMRDEQFIAVIRPTNMTYRYW